MNEILVPLFFFFFFVVASSTIEETSYKPSRTLLYATVSPSTPLPLFSLTLNSNESYFVDITAPLLVRRCTDITITRGNAVPCTSFTCLFSRQFRPSPCSLPNNTVSGGFCACAASSFDPFSSTCGTNLLTRQDILVSSTNPTKSTFLVPQATLLCVPTVFLPTLPPGISGVAGLSRSPLSLAYQLASLDLSVSKRYSLCLPSSDNADNRGVVFFGNVPSVLKTRTNRDADVSRMLSETRLILNSKIPNANYIGLAAISVNGKDNRLGRTGFAFDSNGDGGTLLSTTTQYSTLRSDIYRFLLSEFSNATSQIPRADPVSPFGLCLGLNQTGTNVPRIDLKLSNGEIWSVYGPNSLKKVSDDVACLAFVDGGESPRQAVVIGSYQMENNLLVFDLAKSSLGFSSSLSLFNATCGDFRTG